MGELRLVARYAVESAEKVLPHFEEHHPDDRRSRAAVEAAWAFADGANRTKLQRVAALNAHRAAKDATTGAAKHAAHAVANAAAAAYLHPLTKATRVGHILRAAAHAARATELAADAAPVWGITTSRRLVGAPRLLSLTCSSDTPRANQQEPRRAVA